ncbi:hypothetical protein HDE_07256 [Halotydeus destructor]|nr:hypothetical protein HDE_07256 [Halotydeus destructor]
MVPLLKVALVAAFALSSSRAPVSGAQMTCGPKVSPRLLVAAPCDMSKNGYCSTAGGSYPWSSVRRYIYENQGLVRRMYGEQRHGSVLQNEIDDIRDKYNALSINGWYRPRSVAGHAQFSPRSASVDPLSPIQLAAAANQAQIKHVKPAVGDEHEKNSSTTDRPVAEGQAELSVRNVTEGPLDLTELPTTVRDKAEFDDEETTFSTSSFFSELAEAGNSDPEKGVSGKDESSSSTEGPLTSTSEAEEDENDDAGGFETEPIENKGVNACPVKEEVIAPFWANNTRGETLALLNVYPFEQYVHWEKCSYENSQMFCRDGCRCEQQYRLHRLLAFDPKNECRGIFADWFRFPSCCVCICYDLPETSIFYRINRRKSRL